MDGAEQTPGGGVKWCYSLRWKLPYPCPGEHELVSEVVEAGQPAPASVMSRWVAGAGYAVCLDFISDVSDSPEPY